jgi:hypothetical protein
MQAVSFKSFTHYEICSWHTYYRKKSESNVSANLTTQLSPPINFPIVCENSKAIELNTLNDTNKYITVDKEIVETSSKRQKKLSLFTSQTIGIQAR